MSITRTTLLTLLLIAVPGWAQRIDPQRGVDPRVDYAELTRFGPWDDRNYELKLDDLELLSDNEHELRVAVPAFYRVQLRRQFPGMSRSGPLQYPHSALLAFMSEHHGLLIDGNYYSESRRNGERWYVAMEEPFAVLPEGGGAEPLDSDVQISSPTGGRETAIEISPVNPQIAVAGAVIWPVNTRQEMFVSSDGGSSWSPAQPLPLGGGLGDPTIAWSSDGQFVYTASLSFSLDTLYFYRSSDNGQSWEDLANEPGNDPRREIGVSGSDKEFLHVDQSPSSPFQDNVYMVWDNFTQGNEMKFARSTNFGHTWTSTSFDDEPGGLGVDMTTDAAGKIYYFYPAFAERTIRVLTSTNGGASFSPGSVVADTEASVWIFLPAQETRGALVYVSADTDRSNGLFADSVYAAWNDTSGGRGVIRVAYSRNGGNNWTVVSPHAPDSGADRFLPWLEVDDEGGVHVIYYDTRDDSTRESVHLYHSVSQDGGQSWVSQRLTSQNSPGPDDGFDFGDYNALSITMNQLIAAFADNRDSSVDMWAAGEILDEAEYTLLPTDPGTAGVLNSWTVINGTPQEEHVVYFGPAEGATTLSVGPCQNIGVDVQDARRAGSATADLSGSATVSRVVPLAADGRVVSFQAVDLRTCRVSNVVNTGF